MSKRIICWWSGGITSAVACKIAFDLFGDDSCFPLMIDTKNEDEDTYRFKKDCEEWYGKEIDVISAIPERYSGIEDEWEKYLSLNVANGAVCSSELKRDVRKRWQKTNEFDHQIFGYEFTKREANRALAMSVNHPDSKPIYPLLMMGYTKKKCIEIVSDAGIEIPNAYRSGLLNNNCLKTLCVQGGVGYWQKAKRDFPEKFYAMAVREHNYTDKKGRPVTMLKDQSEVAKRSGNIQVFLVKHPDYPNLKCIDDMPECKIEPLMECNGHCGTNDLVETNKTFYQLNLEL